MVAPPQADDASMLPPITEASKEQQGDIVLTERDIWIAANSLVKLYAAAVVLKAGRRPAAVDLLVA
jgi:hypothetical protein